MKPIIGMIAAESPKLMARKYLVNTPYIDAIIAAGGTPILIPADADAARAAEYLPLLDGLLLPGGEDVTPTLYGQEPTAQVSYTLADKDQMELALVRLAAAQQKPIFGICRGMQLLNVCFGGDLYQDLPTQYDAAICHAQDMAIRSALTHRVRLAPDSLISQLLGSEPLMVNSFHHQAVKTVAAPFTVTATAADGVVEAMESAARGIYAVQWHPEELVADHPRFRPLFSHLVALAEAHRQVAR
ncbi:MAG: gamma-glutamyl-gamma-aminobutyrate hydrolase family protein [Oscillospiraceae bacterium]|nr:gamma-glutamyl-gamma-aminobutyrate hydrolase family protein [Oscillospiraceae bacterium]